jgi:hypothetical protein
VLSVRLRSKGSTVGIHANAVGLAVVRFKNPENALEIPRISALPASG